MYQLFDLNNFILVACVGLIMALAYIVLKSAFRESLNRVFFLISVSASVWIFTNLMANLALSKGESQYYFWTQATLLGPAFLPTLLPIFAHLFPGKKVSINKWLFYVFGIASLLCVVLLPTKYNIISVKIIDASTYQSSFVSGPLYTFFGISLIASLLLTVYIFFKKYRLTYGGTRSQSKFAMIGIASSVVTSLIMSVFLPMFGFSQFINVSPISAILFVGFSAYAIFEHQFMNIKSIIAEIVVYLIMVVIFSEIFFSKSKIEIGIRIVFLLIMYYAGNMLVKSTENEIKQKEELELLARRLEDANVHLKELDKMKDDFLSMASHELNTPLAAIEGYLSMILEEHIGGDLNPQVREYLDRIDKSAIRLAAIVKDLLNVSRIESGRIHLIYKEVQIEDLIQAAINEIMPKVKELGHTINFKRPEQPMPKDWLDDTRITEVVLNMLGNAVKYTPGGGKIEAGVEAKDGELLVWVKDNGKGIPKEKADRVFQKFTQVDVLKDEVKGTGLGMYISQKFIELHKGKIWFESEGEGKGSTFYFSIPILKEKPFDPNEGAGPVLK